MKPKRRATKTDPLEQEIEAALQPGSFIKYGAGWSFVEGLDRVEEKIARLVGSAPAHAVALYETFLAGCYEKAEELDDSSGNFGMFVDGLSSAAGSRRARRPAATPERRRAALSPGWTTTRTATATSSSAIS